MYVLLFAPLSHLCAQAAVAVFIMFSAYILHTWAMPFLTRENVPQTFYDIVNAEGGSAEVGAWARARAYGVTIGGGGREHGIAAPKLVGHVGGVACPLFYQCGRHS